ncbi:MAG: Hcp family type VI secretion system effector [Limisphaerales bacterium]
MPPAFRKSFRLLASLSRRAGVLGLMVGIVVGGVAARGAAFLTLPEVPGESRDAAHLRWIDVASLATTVAVPEVLAGKRPEPVGSSITLVKGVDLASPRLAQAVCDGPPFASATFEFTRALGGSSVVYYRVVLQNVRVTTYKLSASGSGGENAEEVGLEFDDASWTYTEFTAAGRAVADHRMRWDFVRNAGGASTSSKGFTVKSRRQASGVLGIEWTPEPGRRYTLMRSLTLDGAPVAIREIDAVSTGDPRWIELPGGLPFAFFLLREEP